MPLSSLHPWSRLPPLVIPCVMVFVALARLKLFKGPAVRISIYGVLIPLKDVETVVALAAIDS